VREDAVFGGVALMIDRQETRKLMNKLNFIYNQDEASDKCLLRLHREPFM
jgi:hypothetical protein